MIGLLQRVRSASVAVDGETIAAIGHGLLVLVGVQRGDTGREAGRLLDRLLGNLGLRDTGGELLLVPQFTLAADTRSGMRAGFSRAADPLTGAALFEKLVAMAAERHAGTASGRFGADMQVSLVNDGPVTFWLEVSPSG